MSTISRIEPTLKTDPVKAESQNSSDRPAANVSHSYYASTIQEWEKPYYLGPEYTGTDQYFLSPEWDAFDS